MIGISLRHATALGLHLRNKDPAADGSKKDILMHTWWIAYSIECLLNIITGRPPVISDEYCTVPLPDSLPNRHHSSRGTSRHATRGPTGPSSTQFLSNRNYPEFDKDDATSRPYLISRIEISILTRKAQRCLYSPQTATQSWKVSSRLPKSPDCLSLDSHAHSSYRRGSPTY
jgi:hypothetical protein